MHKYLCVYIQDIRISSIQNPSINQDNGNYRGNNSNYISNISGNYHSETRDVLNPSFPPPRYIYIYIYIYIHVCM
jgi:hypothetical protein